MIGTSGVRVSVRKQGEPLINPKAGFLPVQNLPLSSSLENVTTRKEAFPGPRGPTPQFSVKESMWKIASLEDSSPKRIRVVNKPPTLFSLQCIIKILKFSEAQSPIALWQPQLVPAHPMDPYFSSFISPPKPNSWRVQILAHHYLKFE